MSSNSEPEDLGFELPAPAKTSRGVIALAIVGVVGGAFAVGYLQHHGGAGSGAQGARGEVVAPKALQSDQALVLPGVVKALEETKIFPRTQGYVRKWNVDIGDKVKEGQVLVE